MIGVDSEGQIKREEDKGMMENVSEGGYMLDKGI